MLDRFLMLLAAAHIAQHRDDLARLFAAGSYVRLFKRPAQHLDPHKLNADAAGRIGCVATHAKLDGAALGESRGIANRGQIGRAIGNVDTLEQTVPEQSSSRRAKHRIGRRRNKQHGAVAPMPRNHVRHIVRQQPVARFLSVEQPEAGARQPFGAERETRRIKRGRDDAERDQR